MTDAEMALWYEAGEKRSVNVKSLGMRLTAVVTDGPQGAAAAQPSGLWKLQTDELGPVDLAASDIGP